MVDPTMGGTLSPQQLQMLQMLRAALPTSAAQSAPAAAPAPSVYASAPTTSAPALAAPTPMGQASPSATPLSLSLFHNALNSPAAPAVDQSGQTDPSGQDIHSHQYIEQSGKHKGVAGVARDILGTLGDFLLTRLHMKPMYWPEQEQRKLEAAYQGFDQDPQAALDRVADVDFATGVKLKDQYIDNQRQQALVDSTRETRDARVALATQDRVNKNRGVVAAYMNNLAGMDPDARAAAYGPMRSKMIEAYGKTDPELASLLPADYDPLLTDAFLSSADPLYMQRAQHLVSERDKNNYILGLRKAAETERHDKTTEGIGQQNADTNSANSAETVRHHNVTEGIGQQNADTGAAAVTEKGRHDRATEPPMMIRKGKDGTMYNFEYKNGQWVNVGIYKP